MPDDWVKTYGMCVGCEGTGKVDGLRSEADTPKCQTCGGSGSKLGGITDGFTVSAR